MILFPLYFPDLSNNPLKIGEKEEQGVNFIQDLQLYGLSRREHMVLNCDSKWFNRQPLNGLK